MTQYATATTTRNEPGLAVLAPGLGTCILETSDAADEIWEG